MIPDFDPLTIPAAGIPITLTSERSPAAAAPPATHGNNNAGKIRVITPDSRHPLIDPAVRAKLEAIEADARAKGWPPELLWSANFWGQPRGLAAVLDEGDEIIEVTPDHISILKMRRDLLRFRRHAA
jgi:hypothetical protein